jgi:hypothetical protein
MVRIFPSRRAGGLRNPASLDSERAVRNPKDFLEPGFPANPDSNISFLYFILHASINNIFIFKYSPARHTLLLLYL